MTMAVCAIKSIVRITLWRNTCIYKMKGLKHDEKE